MSSLHRQAGSPAAGLSEDSPAETQQPSCELLRLRERDQVASRDHLRFSLQPLPSDALLELERRIGRPPPRSPASESPASARIGRTARTPDRTAPADATARRAVPPPGHRAESTSVGRTAGCTPRSWQRRSRHPRRPYCPTKPPGFPGLGDHGIDEYQSPSGLVGADKGGGEPGQRLGNQDDTRSRSDRPDHDIRAESPGLDGRAGRLTAIASRPARSRSGTIQCQYDAIPPAPGGR